MVQTINCRRSCRVFAREVFQSLPFAVSPGKANQAVGTIAWADAHNKADEWYASAEALRIADNVVLYQRNSGGWPKNIDMGKPFDEAERPALLAQKKETDSTIDNGATYTQLSFLARVYTKHTAGTSSRIVSERARLSASRLNIQMADGRSFIRISPDTTNTSRTTTMR